MVLDDRRAMSAVAATAVAVLGLVVGVLGVLAGLIATVVVQQREDQRAHTAERWQQTTAKRERSRVGFERVVHKLLVLAQAVEP